MDIKTFLRGFVIHFVLVFVVSAIVSYCYSVIVHGQGVADWESSIRFGLIFGIALPLLPLFEKRGK